MSYCVCPLQYVHGELLLISSRVCNDIAFSFIKLDSSTQLPNLCLISGACANQHTAKEYWHGF
jgi:hypothetical protein